MQLIAASSRVFQHSTRNVVHGLDRTSVLFAVQKPELELRRYDFNGGWTEFRPSIKGLPETYDKDLIIYAVSQLISGMKLGRPLAKDVRIDLYLFLTFALRDTKIYNHLIYNDKQNRLPGKGTKKWRLTI